MSPSNKPEQLDEAVWNKWREKGRLSDEATERKVRVAAALVAVAVISALVWLS